MLLEIVDAMGCFDRVIGIADDEPSSMGIKIRGLEISAGVHGSGGAPLRALSGNPTGVILGIGQNQARQRVAESCRKLGYELVTLVHPSAVLSPSAHVGAGTVIMAQVAVNADAHIGEGVILNTGAVIEHDVVLGDFSHVSPRSVLGGGARLGEGSQLGIGGVVLPRAVVGRHSIVGGGATVVHDVPDGVVAIGTPARVLRVNP